MISPDFQKQATGYGLTTAQILYRRPDHPWLLQTYVWRAYDLCPEFPELQGFLEFWQKSLEGVLAFGHGRTFSPYQTGRDQTGGRAVPAALISDRLLALPGSRHSKVDGPPYCPLGSKPKIRMGAIPLEPRKRCA